MPGRPRKPSALLEASGAYDRSHGHPERRRNSEPKESRPLGDPPARLPKSVVPFWDEIVGMAAAGVLKISDRWAVELAARLMHKAVAKPSFADIRKAVKDGLLSMIDAQRLAKKQADGISSAELSTLKSLLASLGMTPADRTKLSVPTEDKPKNKFADLAQETRATSSTSKSVQ